MFFVTVVGFSQSTFVPTNTWYYNMADRYEIIQGEINPYFHTSFKTYQRKDMVNFIDSFDMQKTVLSKNDYFNFSYFQSDNPEFTLSNAAKTDKPLFNTFFSNRNAVYSYRDKDIDVFINPVININTQKDMLSDQTAWQSTRGIEVRGMIGKRVGFYTYLTDNQIKAPEYVGKMVSKIGNYPGIGLTKGYKNSPYTYDFFDARGYITFQAAPFIHMQFGHDKNFIGDGYRSLILSDYSKEYLQLKTTVKVWKINYTIINAELATYNSSLSGKDLRSKFMAMHYLDMNITKKFNIGLFENIIFSRGDSATGNGSYDINYLNPIIFYRALEHNAAVSSDNALLGGTFKWIPVRNLKIYGQFLLDEFHAKEIIKHPESYLNKHGTQLGVKYTNAFKLKNLDLQAEYNVVRPYTYQHFRRETNYSNFAYPLAHPLGANFKELLGIVNVQLAKKFYVMGKFQYATFGTDSTYKQNYGQDINKLYTSALNKDNSPIGQGIPNKLISIEGSVSYMAYHNVFVDLRATYRGLNANTTDKSMFVMIGLRWNASYRNLDF